jgi:predicted metal-dependent phosphoesterase TrpH
MRVDLHVHTSERSLCATSPVAEQLAAAVRSGLDAVAITDHHELTTADERERWQEEHPGLLVLPGIEITLDSEYEDILVIGLDHVELARGHWSWPDLRDFVRERGGLTILAHPFRYAPQLGIDLASDPPDAIEVWSTNTQPRHAAEIRQLARRYGIPVVSNSDAHSSRSLGGYANRLDGPAATAAEVLAAIRTARFTPERPVDA